MNAQINSSRKLVLKRDASTQADLTDQLESLVKQFWRDHITTEMKIEF